MVVTAVCVREKTWMLVFDNIGISNTLYITFFLMSHFSKFHYVLNGMLEMFVINFVELLVSARVFWRQVSCTETSDHTVRDYCVL